ncbi:SusC/RagA family TonB-linked outer membrane protein [Chitinophaga sp. sic0106]|uniref:SusC/RagA family TonB-linked outer membrane protein n=1 Tax=Chitinophaga sp. sic0106 TaxID=2854785 RepID=UPI001C43E902|nr:SusC/RagA family TonB-linked outer membrane protein [Chitinophaga sp. sic0106]MBV7530663.1 SusC/RagA family TonB-linked outer membrane protein [Chitinophaga sp. sic0106]
MPETIFRSGRAMHGSVRTLRSGCNVLFLLFFLCLKGISVYAQSVTIYGKDLTLQQVFKAIQQQTGYGVLANRNVYDAAKPVTLQVVSKPLNELLAQIVSEQQLQYVIKGKTIFISKKVKATSQDDNMDITSLSGHIVDSAGKPLSGASISNKATHNRTVSGEDGGFNLQAKRGDVLIIRFIGYDTKELVIADSNSLVISLKPTVNDLKEIAVVNTGYQLINRTNLTGSVATVGSEELEKRNTQNILLNLEGLVPGLVQYRGNTTIRGVSTIQANANILVVVDGLPIEGSIADVNPYEVESVTVLKDAAAAAIYGARASNGVIVVNTKKAKAKNKTTIELSSNLTVTDKPDYSYQSYMTPAQQVDWESEYYHWWFDGGNGTVSNPVGNFENNVANGAPVSPVQYAYYQYKTGKINAAQLESQLGDYRKNDFVAQYRDQALLSQVLQQYNLALRTNNGKSHNSLVVNYTTDNTGIIHAYNRQINLFYKGAYNIAKWLDLDYGVNSVLGKARAHNNDFATTPYSVPSYFNLFNADGTRAQYSTNRFNSYNTIMETTPGLYSGTFNHLDELERDFVNTSTLNTRYYLNMHFKVLRGLYIQPMVQYEDLRRNVSAYSEAESYTMRWLQDVYSTRTGAAGNYKYTNLLPKGGKLATADIKSPNYTARLQANYDREFGNHGFIAIAGMEFRQTRTYGNNGVLLGYDDQLQTQSTQSVNFGNLYNLNTGTFWNPSYPVRQYHFNEIADMSLLRDELHRFASGYANLTYTYDRKYNLFGSLRKDYADLFGGDEKYRGRPLWSVGASWVASEAAFLKNMVNLDYLKLRTTYGLTGNIRNVTAVLAATTGVNNITQLPNATVTNPPNPKLRWEKTATTNIGLDFSWWQQRLRGSLDWYLRKGTDLFAQKRLDPSEGFTSMVINNASMTNHGIELNLGYDWFRPSSAGGFRWSSQVTGSWNKNKITAVDELTRNPLTLAGGGSYRVGYPVHSLFSFRFAGLDTNGVPQWYDAKGAPSKASLGANDADAIEYSGSADPILNLGFNNDISYKGISLNIFAVYYGGHYYRARPVPTPYPYANYGPMPTYLLNSWTPTNTNTDVPGSGQYYQVPITNQYYYSNNLVRPADFIKIRNIVLGYTLPATVASKIRATSLKMRAQINNPGAIWIKQKDVHVDPETGAAPIPASFVFGINANF